MLDTQVSRDSIGSSAVSGQRHVVRIARGRATSDGAGVKLTRVIGQPGLDMLDPFLMLDEFRSDSASDYIGGFPEHPHRGFETVTYMLAGRMRHGDNQGNSGLLTPGSVQWMTAGRGILHSEMPEQENGLMWGFQLWVNLPASDKMTAPRYQDIAPDQIPEVSIANGAKVRVIAGDWAARAARYRELPRNLSIWTFILKPMRQQSLRCRPATTVSSMCTKAKRSSDPAPMRIWCEAIWAC